MSNTDNTPDQVLKYSHDFDFPLPVMGFAAYSGTGKTTLLTQLIPLLSASGIRIGMVKHAHHDFEIDHAGKDSHQLRSAGANQVLLASNRRTALIEEHTNPPCEPRLDQVLKRLNPDQLDLVLVEGFKREAFPKIELQRKTLKRPLIYPDDPSIVALATDYSLDPGRREIPLLDINNIQQIARFICAFCLEQPTGHPSSAPLQSSRIAL